jgi:ubiquitin carboxyl-terminal hydrolase L5
VQADEIMSRISSEHLKRERWSFENSLRRHNHVGLVHALLLGLAKAGKLSSAQEVAKKTMQARIDKQKATEEEMDED